MPNANSLKLLLLLLLLLPITIAVTITFTTVLKFHRTQNIGTNITPTLSCPPEDNEVLGLPALAKVLHQRGGISLAFFH